MENKYHFFWNGPFSNWQHSEFTDGELTYNCVEQYMMYHKAKLFNDEYHMEQIMESKSPRDQKSFGRSVENFKANVWNEQCYNIVKEGCKMKFEQNSHLRKELEKYSDKFFVEASPYDAIWGIGFSEKDALNNKGSWGKNLLGKVLNDVAKEIL